MTVAAATELWRLSATELAEAIRSRQASSQEVIEAHLRRIEAVNTAINAVVLVMAEQALEAAKAADRAAAGGIDLPPLHGVPFTVKENIDVAGTPTTQGLRALADAYPTRDAPIVERLKGAGAIPIGRTNMPSGAIRWHCESDLWGATLNPWDRSRTPGASRRRGGRDRDRHEPAGARQRRARIASPSGAVLRHQRGQADLGSHTASELSRARGDAADRFPADRCQRPAGTAGSRCAGCLRDHRRPEVA
jgi:hypothetical protein